MALTTGSKVLGSDGEAIRDDISAAHEKVFGTKWTWSSTQLTGILLTYSQLAEMHLAITQCNNGYSPSIECPTHYGSYGTCPSHQSNKSNNGNNWADTGFSNN